MIMFNTYMNQFTFSHHGILIHEKSPLIWMQKKNIKILVFLCEELIQTKTPDFTRGRLYERVKLLSVQRKIGDILSGR